MISYSDAFQLVMNHKADFGVESVSLLKSRGRVLAEPIVADRDFPPFDRSTKDGIGISYSAYNAGLRSFPVEGTAAAGAPQLTLKDETSCFEVMTGAVIPAGCDTIIPYEEVVISEATATVSKPVVLGQHIHQKGLDEKKGDVLINAGCLLRAAEIGVLATVGKAEVQVKRNPKIALVSTGNELVGVYEKPLPHQIRKSNMYSLQADIEAWGIATSNLHLPDQPDDIASELKKAIEEHDVVMLSGGVSMGKFDHIPEVLHQLGVEQVFHKVYQRPGKPFWFGKHAASSCTVFSFPGNPVSTYCTFQVYFKPWYCKVQALPSPLNSVILGTDWEVKSPFTRLLLVKIDEVEGRIMANPLKNSGSGDITALANADAVAILEPGNYAKGQLVKVIHW